MIKLLSKSLARRLAATFALLLASQLGLSQLACAQAKGPVNSPENYALTGKFDPTQLTQHQGFIKVKGNQFIDEAGKPFIFRGVSVADPDRLLKDGKWNKALFEELKRWGVNCVRLPVHPKAWRDRGQAEYLKLLDQAVVWANALDIYLIIDWHSIGFLETGNYQHETYYTDKQETFRFWHDIAYRYQGVATAALFELFNEPTTLNNPWGKTEWQAWKTLNEEMIDIVRATNKQAIPLVAGFNWAYDLTPIKDAPIARDGIAYVSHPYPQKTNPTPPTKENFFRDWDKVWGFAAKRYPIVCTELGWVQPDGYGAHIPVKNDGSYGPQIVEFMAKRGISWIAWVFDPQWSPTMISDWNFTPTEQGAFFKKVLQEQSTR